MMLVLSFALVFIVLWFNTNSIFREWTVASQGMGLLALTLDVHRRAALAEHRPPLASDR